MRPTPFALFALAVCLTPAAASAAALVLGGGDAEACYRAARHGASDHQAVMLCSRALDDEPLSPKDRAATYVNRGVILVNRRAFAEAVADFDHALRLTPNAGEAYLNRGAARLGMKQYREALDDLDRSLEFGSTEPEKAWFNKGIAHEALGDVKAAYLDYSKAQQIRPAWDMPRQELARFTVRER